MFTPAFLQLWNNGPVKKSQRPTPLSEEDLARHSNLLKAYGTIKTGNIPIQWSIDEHKRPTYYYNFGELAEGIHSQIILIHIPHSPICHALRGILTTLAKLFNSLDKRDLGKLRAGSIEEMFLVHFTFMLTQLPSKQFTEISTLKEIERLIAYCMEVRDRILKPEGSESAGKRNNPTAALHEIIRNLESIRIATDELCRSNHHPTISQIENAVLHMTAQTFKILNLMIKFDHSFAPDIEVVPFLSEPSPAHRPRIKSFKELRLSKWLLQTLTVVGVESSDFKGKKSPLTFDQMDKHLDGECVGDKVCTLPESLRDPRHPDWGPWEFTLGEPEEEVNKKLQALRNVHRSILRLHHLQAMLAQYQNIAASYGENGLFIDPLGRKISMTMLMVIETITDHFKNSFEIVWQGFQVAYVGKKAAGLLQPGKEDYIAVQLLLLQKEDVDKQFVRLHQALNSLRGRIGESPVDHAYLYTSTLPHYLMDFLSYFKIEGSDKKFTAFDKPQPIADSKPGPVPESAEASSSSGAGQSSSLAASLSLLSVNTTAAPMGLGSILDKKIKKTSFPFMQVAEALFSNNPQNALPAQVKDNLSIDEQLLAPNTRFHHPLHRLVYEKFLVPNKHYVKRHDLFSLWWQPSDQMPKFRFLFKAVNSLLKYVYAPNPPKHTSPELYFLDLEMVNLFLLRAMHTYHQYFYSAKTFKDSGALIKDALLQFRESEDDTIIISMNRFTQIENVEEKCESPKSIPRTQSGMFSPPPLSRSPSKHISSQHQAVGMPQTP